MDYAAIEAVIKDTGFPGRLVELEGKLVHIDILNEKSERFERSQVGLSEFCDLILDWREKVAARAAQPAAETPERVPVGSAA
jgi:hypothetical protein